MTNADPLEKTCPLCGGDNACAVAAGRSHEACWCWDATLDADALAAIPPASKNRHCICAACGRIEPGLTDEH
ncbi:MAG: hypothetical protein CME59_19500 [Halioglobus sp.]|nr:hypothetical protein [Halioglobus sp.]